ncbi:hypothetical protein [Sphingomonas sp.]|uniref:hypothetical protein n=1 Tax=Sphingomonas sp. TaxID=28214 RepID=UPI0028AB19B9|nr:hypothetical protein [Sphingomonas sp.]
MATVVLTVAGGLIGGPFGASLSGLIGGAIDRQLLFKQGPREGPRLADLRVQTSSYGTAIPQLFGTIRVAGSVIWATDLIEHRATEGGGKGGPRPPPTATPRRSRWRCRRGRSRAWGGSGRTASCFVARRATSRCVPASAFTPAPRTSGSIR